MSAGLEGIDRQDNEATHWTTQKFRKIFKTCTAIVLIFAACGLFGGGALSRRTVAGPNGLLTVEYPRFLRLDSPVHLEFRFKSVKSAIDLRISNNYLREFNIEEFTPPPSATQVDNDFTTYLFNAGAGSEGFIKLKMRVENFGVITGDMSSSGDAIHLQHLVYP
jgi:hypothetical protein